MYTYSRPVIFFDGVCNLCNRSVQFVIKHDKKQQFLFAPLQGIAGAEALKHIDKDQQKISSSAAYCITLLLSKAWYSTIILSG